MAGVAPGLRRVVPMANLPAVKRVPFSALLLLFAGCLATPVSQSGGPGSITVTNTNADAIISAARAVFAEYNYRPSGIDYPDSIAFDKPAGALANVLYGEYGNTTSIRVTLQLAPIPGTSDFRLSTRVSRVLDAGMAGFEDSTQMARLWSAEFKPLLKKVAARAENAGGLGFAAP